ncbi:MAG: hypothetical protein CMJ18_17155 [Phycisphaeraceae bacterium]|nr:hypothetical protein [Phycisphaeraceae bacterium]
MTTTVFDKLTRAGMTDGPHPDFIPLRVENWKGVPGRTVYAGFGVMLPQGWLPADRGLCVEDDTGQVTPCQVNRLHAWPDDSAHSVHVIFPLVTPTGEPREWRLVRADGAAGEGIRVVESEELLRIDNGVLQIDLARNRPQQVRQITRDGRAILAGDGFSVTPFRTRIESDGSWTYPIDSAQVTTEVRESGLYQLVVHRTYVVTDRYRQEIDFTFYRDMPLVHVLAWGIRTGEPPEKLTHEVAVTAEFDGEAEPILASRFCRRRGPLEDGVLSVDTPEAGTAHLILPWFREFGMESPRNLEGTGGDGAYRATWCPVHSGDDNDFSPMNARWSMDRYWREAALWIDDESAPSAGALAARQQMRFEGVIVEPAAAHAPESFVLGSGVVMEEDFQQAVAFAEGLMDYRLKEEYPRGLAFNRDVHNWNPAYLYGHYWRHIVLDAPGGGTAPHACKGDWGEWLLDLYRITRDPRLLKRVHLQARAIVTEYADGPFVDRGNQGVIGPRDDVGVQPWHEQERYTEAQRNEIAYQSNLYAARDWPLLHLMSIRTGDRTYFDIARLVMDNLHKHGTGGEGSYEFRTDRDQHRIENLCKVAALYGDKEALRKAEVTATPAAREGKLPPWSQGGDLEPAIHGGPPGRSGVNMYTSLYMCVSYQLLHEMTGDEAYATVHRALRDETLKWIDTYDTDGAGVPTIVEPNPAPNHMIVAAIQLMSLLVHDYLITRNPDDLRRYRDYRSFVQRHGLITNPWGPGEFAHTGIHAYTMEPGIEDQVSNYRNHYANLFAIIDVCGPRWFWAGCTYARILFEPSYHAGRRRLSIDLPWKLPETTDPQKKQYGLRWPGGKLVYLGTARRIHVMGGYEGGTLAMRIRLPWNWQHLAFKLNGRPADLAITTVKETSAHYVDYEDSRPFSLEIRRQD